MLSNMTISGHSTKNVFGIYGLLSVILKWKRQNTKSRIITHVVVAVDAKITFNLGNDKIWKDFQSSRQEANSESVGRGRKRNLNQHCIVHACVQIHCLFHILISHIWVTLYLSRKITAIYIVKSRIEDNSVILNRFINTRWQKQR